MRAFNQVRSIVAFHIQPLTDFNEYTFHFIEVVHTHLRNTKGAAVSDPLPPHPTRSTPHALHTPRAPHPTLPHTCAPHPGPPAARLQHGSNALPHTA
jgi:replication factor A2